MRRTQGGAALLAALLLSTVLLLVGMGFLGQRRGEYTAALEHVRRSQAGALADAGLQDALGKLAKDVGFPPLRSDDQGSFVYSEELFNADGESVGFFQVTVDVRYQFRPYRILRIISRGMVGDRKNPTATVTRKAEIDIDEGRDPFRVLYVTTNEDE